MKKIFSLLVSLLLCVSFLSFTGCKEPDNDTTVSLKYYGAAPELLQALKQGVATVGVLPEPVASTLEKTDSKKWYRLDLQQLYDSEKSSYPQAVLMVKTSLLNSYNTEITQFAEGIDDNVSWAKENVSDAISAINDSLPEGTVASFTNNNLTASVIENCKIKWQGVNTQTKEQVKNYIDDIMSISDKSATAVTDDLFYNSTATQIFNGEKITVAVPDGAPALAIAKYIKNGVSFEGKPLEFNVVKADQIGTSTADIKIMPVNAATKTYNKNALDPYVMLGIVTHGNLYIMSTEQISKDDLGGKTIGLFGLGQVPDLTTQSVLKKLSYQYKVAI